MDVFAINKNDDTSDGGAFRLSMIDPSFGVKNNLIYQVPNYCGNPNNIISSFANNVWSKLCINIISI